MSPRRMRFSRRSTGRITISGLRSRPPPPTTSTVRCPRDVLGSRVSPRGDAHRLERLGGALRESPLSARSAVIIRRPGAPCRYLKTPADRSRFAIAGGGCAGQKSRRRHGASRHRRETRARRLPHRHRHDGAVKCRTTRGGLTSSSSIMRINSSSRTDARGSASTREAYGSCRSRGREEHAPTARWKTTHQFSTSFHRLVFCNRGHFGDISISL